MIAYVLEYKFHVSFLGKLENILTKNWIPVHSSKIVKQTYIDHM